MFTYGLVFRMQDQVWLALFDEHGNIEDADTITDPEGVYDTLAPNAMSFVSVERYGELNLSDLQTITVSRENCTDEEAILMMLDEGDFPDFAREIWSGWGN